MKKSRKKYERPMRIWDKQRIEKERVLVKNFGLSKKREIWMSESLLRKYRRMARGLAAKKDKEKEKVLLNKLIKLGLLQEGASLDNVLDLNLETFLERRLQTVIQKKGFANTVKQARQFITHGHVKIGERKIVYPGYLVSKEDEERIQVDMTVNKPKVVPTGS
jgi:small subunit ribosomal protein S4